MDSTHFLSDKSLSNFKGHDPTQVHHYGLDVGFSFQLCTPIGSMLLLLVPPAHHPRTLLWYCYEMLLSFRVSFFFIKVWL